MFPDNQWRRQLDNLEIFAACNREFHGKLPGKCSSLGPTSLTVAFTNLSCNVYRLAGGGGMSFQGRFKVLNFPGEVFNRLTAGA